MKEKEYTENAKLNAGPGGWKCPCCNPYGVPTRKMRKLAHRRIRRTKKNLLKKELDEF